MLGSHITLWFFCNASPSSHLLCKSQQSQQVVNIVCFRMTIGCFAWNKTQHIMIWVCMGNVSKIYEHGSTIQVVSFTLKSVITRHIVAAPLKNLKIHIQIFDMCCGLTPLWLTFFRLIAFLEASHNSCEWKHHIFLVNECKPYNMFLWTRLVSFHLLLRGLICNTKDKCVSIAVLDSQNVGQGQVSTRTWPLRNRSLDCTIMLCVHYAWGFTIDLITVMCSLELTYELVGGMLWANQLPR